ncbi:MAG: DUF115 domain-containing protein [Lachnospiraceae bacterium]|nr:DUF115 domain-containing protein [Lachnospiraceae bacterium]
MEQSVEEMYKDALAVTRLQETLRWGAVGAPRRTRESWERASALISGLIPRIGMVNMETAGVLMKAWKATRESGDDIRALSACIDSVLLPVLKDALGVLYDRISFTVGNLEVRNAGFGFFSLKDLVENRCLHDPYDPMREAVEQARELYSEEMGCFHILGVGLGYLAWQVWEQSEHSVDIYIYEDDQIMLQLAYQVGVLSWIDREHLIVVEGQDAEKMLQRFLYTEDNSLHNHYVSDWKLRAYQDFPSGWLVDNLDFNERTGRDLAKRQKINLRVNSQRDSFSMDSFPKALSSPVSECVLVSAGPSLNDNLDFLRESVGKRTVMVVNTAIRKLEKEMIRPDAAILLDPNPVLKDHIEGIEIFTEDIPLVADLTASKEFLSLYRGKVFFLPRDGMTGEHRWDFGGTVASLGLDLAFFLGAKKIYLIGSDLAYPGGANYADGVSRQTAEGVDETVEVLSSDGSMVKTNLLYNCYRRILERQIASHPDVQVFNMSRHGAKIAGCGSWEEV